LSGTSRTNLVPKKSEVRSATAAGAGEVATGRPKSIPGGNTSVTVADIGITSKDIHDARKVRDAEKEEPGR
jgi:hypothetical protein